MVKKYFLLILFMIAAGCSHPIPKCVKPSMETLVIRWGESNNKSKIFSGYELNHYGLITKIDKDSAGKEKRNDLNYVSPEEYCSLLTMVEEIMLKTQVINEPSDLNRFIEYSNSGENVFMRASWNAKFDTYNSKFFRVIYDSLNFWAKIK